MGIWLCVGTCFGLWFAWINLFVHRSSIKYYHIFNLPATLVVWPSCVFHLHPFSLRSASPAPSSTPAFPAARLFFPSDRWNRSLAPISKIDSLVFTAWVAKKWDDCPPVCLSNKATCPFPSSVALCGKWNNDLAPKVKSAVDAVRVQSPQGFWVTAIETSCCPIKWWTGWRRPYWIFLASCCVSLTLAP